MMVRNILASMTLIAILGSAGLFAQSDSPKQQAPQKEVIDLGAIKIDARVELPQVQIVDTRIEPDFENVRAEKSFMTELSGKTEQLKFEAITSGQIKTIKNVNTLLNKKRF